MIIYKAQWSILLNLSDPTTTILSVYQTYDSKDTIWWLQDTKLLLRQFYLTNMFLTLLTLIAFFLFDSTLGKAFDSQCNDKAIFSKRLERKATCKGNALEQSCQFLHDSSEIRNKWRPCFYYWAAFCPRQRPCNYNFKFLAAFKRQTCIAASWPTRRSHFFYEHISVQIDDSATSSLSHIHIPTNATNTATGFRIHYDSHQTSLNDETIAHIFATTARTTATMTNVFTK